MASSPKKDFQMNFRPSSPLSSQPASMFKAKKSRSRNASFENVIDAQRGHSLQSSPAKKAPASADVAQVLKKVDMRGLPQVASVSSRLWTPSKASRDSYGALVEDIEPVEWAIAIHGGAGEIKHTETINDRLAEFKKILQAGKKLLAEGRTAVEVAEEVTCLLEDCPWFNAGKGSVFTNSGTQEMDASIMDGSTLNAGACAAVCTIKNPIKLARTVMEKTSHILIVGPAAEQLGYAHGLERADPHYFFVQERYDQLCEARRKGIVTLDHNGELPAPSQNYSQQEVMHKGVDNLSLAEKFGPRMKDSVPPPESLIMHPSAKQDGGLKVIIKGKPELSPVHRSPQHAPVDMRFVAKPTAMNRLDKDINRLDKDIPHQPMADANSSPEEVRSWALEEKYSTVGCVVKDRYGNLASAGSTGGMTNKQPGRMGDTAIIGAGVYASEKAAVACTGHGETFIRHSVAHQIDSRMRYLDENIEEALASVMWQVLPPLSGGAVAVDEYGRLAASYNTFGMFTGLADSTGYETCWDKADREYTPEDVYIPDVYDERYE